MTHLEVTPRKLHFVCGLEPVGMPTRFTLLHYIAIRSAVLKNPGYEACVHVVREPEGSYWAAIRPDVTLMHLDAASLPGASSQAGVVHPLDILRLQVLLDHGGIYLDIDTITQKTFEPLLSSAVVMGLEVATVARNREEIMGLSVATILAPPNAPFVRAWRESYDDVSGADLPQHASRRSYAILRGCPEFDVRIEPPRSFCWPSWDHRGLEMLFMRDLTFPQAYCLRLWEEHAAAFVGGLTEADIHTDDSSYNRLARPCLAGLPDSAPAGQGAANGAAGLRLNLGCGADRRDGWVNADRQAGLHADLRFDIEKDVWPLPRDSVAEVALAHVLQFVGAGLRHVMSELYRVCRHDAVIDIRVPHHTDPAHLIDPLVVRRFHPEFFYMFDRGLALHRFASRDPKSPVAMQWDIDFVIDRIELDPELVEAARQSRGDPFIDALAEPNRALPGLLRADSAPEIAVRLRANKPDPATDSVSRRFDAIDEAWYLARNPDVAAAVAGGYLQSATHHYVWHGHAERRMPREILIDEAFYLTTYPDVREAVSAGAFASGQAHFEQAGYREGRHPADPSLTSRPFLTLSKDEG